MMKAIRCQTTLLRTDFHSSPNTLEMSLSIELGIECATLDSVCREAMLTATCQHRSTSMCGRNRFKVERTIPAQPGIVKKEVRIIGPVCGACRFHVAIGARSGSFGTGKSDLDVPHHLPFTNSTPSPARAPHSTPWQPHGSHFYGLCWPKASKRRILQRGQQLLLLA